MNTFLTDTHVHLYDEVFEGLVHEVVCRAQKNHVSQMLLPNTNLQSLPKMMEIVKKFPGVCFPMIGLHPCYVKEDFIVELDQMEKFFVTDSYVAVGEIGLDLYWEKNNLERQIQALQIQLGWAKKYRLPVVLHSREATAQTIAVVKKSTDSSPIMGVFHCFSGTLKEAQEIIAMGMYLGIGGSVTYKKSTLPQILPQIPLQNIVLETDAPYLAPVPFRGKVNEPMFIPHVVHQLCDIYKISFETICAITTSNAQKLFGLKPFTEKVSSK